MEHSAIIFLSHVLGTHESEKWDVENKRTSICPSQASEKHQRGISISKFYI